MSDDELEKLAAEMQNIQPSADSRKEGMAAAMAAFDLEFASEISETTVKSEENIEATQGLGDAPRPTGQITDTGSVQTFGSDMMAKINTLFTFKPRTMMLAGSCMAALFAGMVIMPNMSDLSIEDQLAKSTPPTVSTTDITDEVAAVETPSVTAPAKQMPTGKSNEAIIQEPVVSSTEPKVQRDEIDIKDKTAIAQAAPVVENQVSPPQDVKVTPPALDASKASTVETPSNIVVIERQVLKTPARTQERVIPAVPQQVTRRVVKTPASTQERVVPAITKEVTRRVMKTPASTQERSVPAVTKQHTRRVKKEDGTFETVTETVVVQEASSELVTIPPTFETVTETIVVQEASTEFVTVPATYETVTETIVTQEASTELVTIPPVYETVRDTIKINSDGSRQVLSSEAVPTTDKLAKASGGISSVSSLLNKVRSEGISPGREMAFRSKIGHAPASITTGAGSYAIGTTSSHTTGGRVKPSTAGQFTVFNGVTNQVVQSTQTIVSETGEILCRVLIPAKYKTITKQVLVSPARTVEREVPAVTKDITVKVANEDGSFKEVIKTIVIQEAWTDLDVIPAVYETRSERILVAPAREEWKPGSQAINASALLTPIVPPKPKPKPKPAPQSGLLTAGDYDDVLNPDLYKVYLDKMLQGSLRDKNLPYVDANERISIRVVDNFGKVVPMADISLTTSNGKKMFPLRTGADGMAYLYPHFDNLKPGIKIKVSAKGARSAKTKLTRTLIQNGGDIVVDLKMNSKSVAALDLLLTIDATGSMGDEMRYLQSELKAIVGRVEEDNPGIDIRTGLVVYRDKGDAYVVREIPFTDDIEDFRQSLSEQNARGGGDKPEAVHTAMQTGLSMDWREDALKVNLLVADAPPHDQYIDETWEAGLVSRTRGIHIVPLAASGVDKTAEFLMRSMAQITGGRFLFLTDDSGIGNPHAEPTVDCYIVTRLDGLVTRVLSSLIKGHRVEPEAGHVIRSVGNYRSGVCAIDNKLVNIPSQNVTNMDEQ